MLKNKLTKTESHINEMIKALLNEKEEDWLQHKNLFNQQSIDARKKSGVTWYPIIITNTEHFLADSILVEIENKGFTPENNTFSSGKNVEIFTNQNGNSELISATIKMVKGNYMKLVIQTEELPEWIDDGKLGINLMFDDLSYMEMEKAMEELKSKKNKRANELLKIILHEETPNFINENNDRLVPGLNLSQVRAIRQCLNANDFALLHGPPGTGKTSTLVQTIRLCLETEKQVLVCAPTNNAVDLLAEKLNEMGVSVLRIGNPARVSEEQIKLTLDGRLQEHIHYKEIKTLKRNAEEYFRMAGKYKRVFGKEEAQQRALYYKEARQCLSEARMLEDFITDQVIQNAQAIVCTPVMAAGKWLRQKKFNTLFLDEASQFSEPLSWIPMLKCQRTIMAGDHFQLPPLIKSPQAGYLKINLFERLMGLNAISSLLNVQYRMNNTIMGFSNEWFYKNKLVSDESVKDQRLSTDEENVVLFHTLEFIDTAGCGFEEEINQENLSLYNTGESEILVQHLKQLKNALFPSGNLNECSFSCGIISPYKAQVQLLQNTIEENKLNEKSFRTEVKTIDGFQGDEKDIIYVSLVRSNIKNEIGFLSELRRSNVAFTRAKKKLIVIGDSATLANHPYYKSFIDYCEKNGRYASAWEWLNA